MQSKLYLDTSGLIDQIDYLGNPIFDYFEVEPEMVSPFNIVKEKVQNSEIEQYFYRFEWGKVTLKNLSFGGKETAISPVQGYRAFDFINGFEYSRRILIKHVTPLKTIVGYFGKNDCEFDEDNGIIIVTPSTLDEYTEILENWETEVDFTNYVGDNIDLDITVPSSTLVEIRDWPGTGIHDYGYPVNKVLDSDYQDHDGLEVYFDGEKPKAELFEDSYWKFEYTSSVYKNGSYIKNASYTLASRISIMGETPSSDLNSEAFGPTLDMHYGDWELSRFRVFEGGRSGGLSGKRWRSLYCYTWFTREEITIEDIVDLGSDWGYTSPVGVGWHMRIATTLNSNPAHVWTRKPFNGAYFESWTKSEVIPGTNGAKLPENCPYKETFIDYTNTTATQTASSRSVDLRTFVNYILSTSFINLQFRSTFFFNDDESVLSNIFNGLSGYNYVTGSKNTLNNIRILFTKDFKIKDSESTTYTEDSIKFKLKDFIDELNKLFVCKLIWFIDSNGFFRIEHKKYQDATATFVDISTDPMIDETNKWSFDKSQMFELFTYNQTNAGYPDFTNNKLTFNAIVSSNRNEDLSLEVKTTIISTDLKYCMLNPNDLADGILLISLDSSNKVVSYMCKISKNLEKNGNLAFSSILFDYGRYDGVDIVGVMNNENVIFSTICKNKLGIELTLKGLVESMYYFTQIGYGQIESGTVDFEMEYTKIKLRYRFNSLVLLGSTAIAYQKSTDFDGAVNTWADIANYTI